MSRFQTIVDSIYISPLYIIYRGGLIHAIHYNLEEAAGAVGDYGTLFPIIVGVAVVSELKFGYILLFFSIWYILTGLYYKKPVPVEPMKAIGAIVIGGEFTQGQITASGIILGVLFLAVGFGKGMKYIQDKVP